MYEYWLSITNNPALLALFIILGTYLLEDAAIISAALLSADGLIAPELAFFALFVGIFTGDLGLYALGYLLKRMPVLARWIGKETLNTGKSWLKQRMTVAVLLVRVIPGLRLPTYTACGFLGVSFRQFFVLVCFASIVWTGAVFLGFFNIGTFFWAHLSEWKWLFLPVFLVLIVIGYKKITAYFTQVLNDER